MGDCPEIDAPYRLSPDQIAAFNAQGFIRLKDVFSADCLKAYGQAITALTLDLNQETRPLGERSTYDRAFLQVMNLWAHSDRVREFVFSKRLARLAAELLQVKGVRLYHDQSLYKEPGGGITPAHADQYYWPLASDRTVTAWIPLQPVPEDMGPLGFYAQSQSASLGRDLAISDESEAKITTQMEASGFEFVTGGFDLGEVSFHLGWTFHRAGPNLSQQPRSVMTVIYMDSGMRLAAPTNTMQAADRDQWCPGIEAGQIVASPLNPILYEAA